MNRLRRSRLSLRLLALVVVVAIEDVESKSDLDLGEIGGLIYLKR